MTRNRTNVYGLTSDFILSTIRFNHPKAIEVKRHGNVFRVLRKATRGDVLKSNQRGVWEAVGEFDQFRLTRNGALTIRPDQHRG